MDRIIAHKVSNLAPLTILVYGQILLLAYLNLSINGHVTSQYNVGRSPVEIYVPCALANRRYYMFLIIALLLYSRADTLDGIIRYWL
jgi:hypothetical protein